MKILLVGDYPPPHGGISVHVQQLQHYLAKQGELVHVLNIGKGRVNGDGVTSLRSKALLPVVLDRFIRDGFVPHLHTSGNNAKAWAVALGVAAIARARGAPAMLTIHSGLFPAFVRAGTSRRRLVSAALAGYSRVVAVSEAVARSARELAPRCKLTVAPAFIASEVQPGKPPSGLAAVRARHSPLFCYAYHPSPVYGRTMMFEAIAYAETKWPFLGLAVFGTGTQRPDFRGEVDRLGLNSRIHALGELQHSEVLAVMQQCDAFIRPTSADGDAVSVREAIALGVPCVASDVSARPEGTHVFRTGSIPHLVETLVRALESPRVTSRGPDAGDVLMELYSAFQEKSHATSTSPELAHRT